MPVVFTVGPLSTISLPVVLKLASAAVLPMAWLNTTLPLAPVADIVKALAVPSLLTAPLVEITAPSPLANNTELPLSVIAPVYV